MPKAIKKVLYSWILFYHCGSSNQHRRPMQHVQAFFTQRSSSGTRTTTPARTTVQSSSSSSSFSRTTRFSNALESKKHETIADANPTWFSDDDLTRSNVPTKLDATILASSRFLIAAQEEQSGAAVSKAGRKKKQIIKHWYSQGDDNIAIPLFLTYDDIVKVVGSQEKLELIVSRNDVESQPDIQLFWIGERHNVNYFVLYYCCGLRAEAEATAGQVDPVADSGINGGPTTIATLSPLQVNNNNNPQSAPLREFGDRISSPEDAAIYSTANGLIEFHRCHKFCSYCGSPTLSTKAGSSRTCSNHPSLSSGDGSCCQSPTSIYPRIDVASIMLITSPCENYALLGRKKSWPKGRYSTLAGFLEIGETMEQCCVRETLEESGVHVDRSSLRFVKSQPWPFPRSLMTGFRARAAKWESGSDDNDDDNDDESGHLPVIRFDEKEMEDVRWFHRSYVAQRITEGSTALSYEPMGGEEEFHIPGKSSLARYLILEWIREEQNVSTATTTTAAATTATTTTTTATNSQGE